LRTKDLRNRSLPWYDRGLGKVYISWSALSNLILNRYSNSLENSRRDCQLICADTN
jgi:hypothetical protein